MERERDNKWVRTGESLMKLFMAPILEMVICSQVVVVQIAGRRLKELPRTNVSGLYIGSSENDSAEVILMIDYTLLLLNLNISIPIKRSSPGLSQRFNRLLRRNHHHRSSSSSSSSSSSPPSSFLGTPIPVMVCSLTSPVPVQAPSGSRRPCLGLSSPHSHWCDRHGLNGLNPPTDM